MTVASRAEAYDDRQQAAAIIEEDPAARRRQLIAALNAEAADVGELGDGLALHEEYNELAARDAADRYLAVLRRVEAEREAAEDEYKLAVGRLKQRHDARLITIERRAAWLVRGLELLFAFIPVRSGKSVKLLEGRLGRRQATRAGIGVLDVDAAVAWARIHAPAAVIEVPATVELDSSTLKAAVFELRDAGQLRDVAPDVAGPRARAGLASIDEAGVLTPVPFIYVAPTEVFEAKPDKD